MREVCDAIRQTGVWRSSEERRLESEQSIFADSMATVLPPLLPPEQENGVLTGLRQRRAAGAIASCTEKGTYRPIPGFAKESGLAWRTQSSYLTPFEECRAALADGKEGVERVFNRLRSAWLGRSRALSERQRDARTHEVLACLDALIETGNLIQLETQPIDAFLWKAVALELVKAPLEQVLEAYSNSIDIKRGKNCGWAWIREVCLLQADYLDRVGLRKDARTVREKAFEEHQDHRLHGRSDPQGENEARIFRSKFPHSTALDATIHLQRNRLNLPYYLDVFSIDPEMRYLNAAITNLP